VAHRCLNLSCPAQIIEALKHFAGRRAINIEKLGDKIIEALFNAKLVQTFSDFYELDVEKLSRLERMGEKSAANILRSIETSRETTLARLIFALGIRFVGEQTAKSLAQYFLTADAFLAATSENLQNIPDIGPKVADALIQALAKTEFQNEVQRLQKKLKLKAQTRSTTGTLIGLTFLVTGTLPVSRVQAHELIESHGGQILSGVSSKLSFLVAGDSPGSKVEKAEKLKVPILDWDSLLKKIGGSI
jgi:DNA ligase (NAD+)